MTKLNETINQKLNDIIFDVISEVNEDLDDGKKLAFSNNAVLWGETSPLDSIGFVGMLVKFETALASNYGKPIRLMDNKAMSATSSPFRTLGTLAEHIQTTLKANGIDNE
ncbi:MAG: hypothetical protein LBQ66_02855 [Planctomycetaceae bacterium]|jgi:hypothetical protein|nr:hypothetical protein [Planctomycetaceae bacterium]